jgi:NADH pyrophosphatase NudC (nudix superfamily)
MNYCSHCGETVDERVPPGDNRLRYVCGRCDTIHYQNPRIVAGCLAVHEQQVLLCRRAIEPRRGFWTLPAGFMENGETTEQAALRETWEEARARVRSQELYLFHEHEIPWSELAFPTIGKTLKQYFIDRQVSAFPVRMTDINFPARSPRQTV